HCQDLLRILEIAERRVGELDRFNGERVGIGRRGIERADDAGIMTSHRVVDQHRKQVSISWCLRRDDDRQWLKLCCASGLYDFEKFAARTTNDTKLVVNTERGRRAIRSGSIRRESAINGAPRWAHQLLRAILADDHIA